eukprot:6707502-Alexandrium_andersonii.AAC.1
MCIRDRNGLLESSREGLAIISGLPRKQPGRAVSSRGLGAKAEPILAPCAKGGFNSPFCMESPCTAHATAPQAVWGSGGQFRT